jgi:hypothetical protein
VEVAVFVAALATLLAAALPLVVAEARSLLSAIELSGDTTRLASFEGSAREAIGRVRLPHWWTTFGARPREDGSMELPYLDGLPGAALTFSREGEALVLRSGGAALSRLLCADARLSPVRDASGRMTGVEMWILVRPGRAVTIVSRLGSITVGGMQ